MKGFRQRKDIIISAYLNISAAWKMNLRGDQSWTQRDQLWTIIVDQVRDAEGLD